jgi:hypothetical protein
VSFAAITLCVASLRIIPKVSIYFVIDSVRKLSDTPSYIGVNGLTYLAGVQQFIVICTIKLCLLIENEGINRNKPLHIYISYSGHEFIPMNDLFSPYDYIRLVFSLVVFKVYVYL